MSKVVQIQNFYKANGNWKLSSVDSINTLHKDIVGFTPCYSNIVTELQDSSVYDKIEPQFPLVLTKELTDKFTPNIVGEMTAIIKSNDFINQAENLATFTSNGKLYARNVLLADIATNWSTTFNETADLQFFVDRYFVSCSNQPYVYWYNVNTSTHGRIAISSISTQIQRSLVKLGNRLYVSNGTTGQVLGYINTAFTYTDASTISGYSIRALINYQDRYVLNIASVSDQLQPYVSDWVILYSTGTSTQFEYKLPIKGDFIGYVQDDNDVYVLHLDGTDLICSVVNGLSLQEVSRIKGHSISYPTNTAKSVNYRNRVTKIQDYFVFVTRYNGETGIFFWNIKTGESFMPYRNITNRPNVAFGYTNNGTFNLLVGQDGLNGIKQLKLYEGNSVPTALYQSEYFAFPEERCIIQRIDVVFDPTFPTTNDKMSLTLDYYDKFISPTKSTFEKLNMTTSFPDTDVNIDATRLIVKNIGITGTEFAIKLNITNVSGNWNLIIKSIDIHYIPSSQQT